MHAALCRPPASSAFCSFHQILLQQQKDLSAVGLSVQFSCRNREISAFPPEVSMFCVFYNISQHHRASSNQLLLPQALEVCFFVLFFSLKLTS